MPTPSVDADQPTVTKSSPFPSSARLAGVEGGGVSADGAGVPWGSFDAVLAFFSIPRYELRGALADVPLAVIARSGPPAAAAIIAVSHDRPRCWEEGNRTIAIRAVFFVGVTWICVNAWGERRRRAPYRTVPSRIHARAAAAL